MSGWLLLGLLLAVGALVAGKLMASASELETLIDLGDGEDS